MSRSSSSQQMTAEHPNDVAVGHDLVSDGDLEIGPLDVSRSDSVLISVLSTDGNAVSVSVKHHDVDQNVFQNESATDISLSSTTEGWARLTRKGPLVTVTITDESGGASNSVNAFVDTEP